MLQSLPSNIDEYENTSKLITSIIESQKDDNKSIEMYKKVIEPTNEAQKSNINEKELLNQIQSIEKQTNGLGKIEIENVGDTVVVTEKTPQNELTLRKN